MNKKVDIHKSAGVLLQQGKFLIARSKGKGYFIAPGGKVEPGETTAEALCRELNEELGITVIPNDLLEFGTFFAPAAGQQDRQLQMDVFIVCNWTGEPRASCELEEIKWIDSQHPSDIELSSIFKHNVLPKLKELNLIK